MIIDKSSTRPAWSRARDWTLSAIMWLLYLYMVGDALVVLYRLAVETLAWTLTGDAPASLPAITQFLYTLRNYALVVIGNGAVLLIWARYNQFRFRGVDRRKPRQPVNLANLAALYRLPAEEIASWQKSRMLVMHHAADGTLLSVISQDRPRTPTRRYEATPLKEAG